MLLFLSFLPSLFLAFLSSFPYFLLYLPSFASKWKRKKQKEKEKGRNEEKEESNKKKQNNKKKIERRRRRRGRRRNRRGITRRTGEGSRKERRNKGINEELFKKVVDHVFKPPFLR